MSGIRAHDPELLRLGLTLPGFVHRSKVIASLPSLGLLQLAAVTPDGHDLRYFEAEGDGKEPRDVYECDLVAISTFTAQVNEAYAIADRLRHAGVLVAMGGLHVSVLPDEAALHADYVAIGEGEHTWPAIVRHADDANIKSSPAALGLRFDAANYPPVDVATLPVPRYDLLDGRAYNRFTVQTTRGCPWRCDFCASTIMLNRPYRKRPVQDVVRDIRAIQALRPDAFIEFADDNTFVDKRWGRELCDAIAPLNVHWFTETDISVADDPDLLAAMARAGCRQVLVGLESPTREALSGIELRNDFKRDRFDRYRDAIRAIQSHRITVNGCFVLGLDGHTVETFSDVCAFAMETGLYDVQITVMTPFPGTPLYDRLRDEDRLIEPTAWHRCTLFDVNYRPRDMTIDDLQQGMRWLTTQLYTDHATKLRRRKFLAQSRSLIETN